MNAANTSRGRRDEVAASSRMELEEVVSMVLRQRNHIVFMASFSLPPLPGGIRNVSRQKPAGAVKPQNAMQEC